MPRENAYLEMIFPETGFRDLQEYYGWNTTRP